MKYISILRGINVGGKRKILMADLKKLYEKLDFEEVETYIQSGNVIFNFNKNQAIESITDTIRKAIQEHYGFEVPVIVRTVEEWRYLVENNPFLKEGITDIERLHVTFLVDVPEKELVEKSQTVDSGLDKFHLSGKDVFIFCSAGYSDSKLTNGFFETKLKQTATTRNWKTVMKLHEMIN